MDWIVSVRFRDLTPDRYHEGYKPELIRPIEAVVMHYTASQKPNATRNWLTRDDQAYVSTHFIIERDGDIWQLAPLTDRTWHAGGASSKLFGRGNVNGRTLGIEIMNVGPLLPDGIGWKTAAGKPFRGSMVCAGGEPYYRHEIWEAYGAPQVEALSRLVVELVTLFPALGREPETRLVGHQDVDPSRKSDPGPAFPWPLIREVARLAVEE